MVWWHQIEKRVATYAWHVLPVVYSSGATYSSNWEVGHISLTLTAACEPVSELRCTYSSTRHQTV